MNTDERRQELINQCRYYKGEKESPYEDGDRSSFWFYELKWVQFNLEETDLLQRNINQYQTEGGIDIPGIPPSLTALLFNRYCYWGGESVERFRHFINESYLRGYKTGLSTPAQ